MENKRKMKCSCGGEFGEDNLVMEGVVASALVCSSCGRITFTKEQAIAFAEKKEKHALVDCDRRVILIGNSLGITLPERLGLKVGRKVRLEALDRKSFRVVVS